MTIIATAPVPEHHRLDRGTTINLTSHAETLAVQGYQTVSPTGAKVAARCDHPGGLAQDATCSHCLPEGLTKAQADTYSSAFDAARREMWATCASDDELVDRVYAARLWMRTHPEANLATADDALVGRWDAYSEACRMMFPAVQVEVRVLEERARLTGHAEARKLGARVSALPTPHIYASASAACPPWCGGHVPADDDETLHTSNDLSVPMSGGGMVEQGDAVVCVERLDHPGHPVAVAEVRLETAGGPMTAVEALQLAATLQAAAFAALLDTRNDKDDTVGWALALADQPTVSVAMRHGYTVEQATKVQAIVTDLVAQMEAEGDA